MLFEMRVSVVGYSQMFDSSFCVAQGAGTPDRQLIPICQKAWQRLYGFSNCKMTKLKSLFDGGVEQPVHRNKGSVALTTKRAEAVAYMTSYFQDNCEKLPDPSGCTASWHLPCTTTKEDIYKLYRAFLLGQGADPTELVCGTYFKDIWREDFPHVTIPVRSRFAQCTE